MRELSEAFKVVKNKQGGVDVTINIAPIREFLKNENIGFTDSTADRKTVCVKENNRLPKDFDKEVPHSVQQVAGIGNRVQCSGGSSMTPAPYLNGKITVYDDGKTGWFDVFRDNESGELLVRFDFADKVLGFNCQQIRTSTRVVDGYDKFELAEVARDVIDLQGGVEKLIIRGLKPGDCEKEEVDYFNILMLALGRSKTLKKLVVEDNTFDQDRKSKLDSAIKQNGRLEVIREGNVLLSKRVDSFGDLADVLIQDYCERQFVEKDMEVVVEAQALVPALVETKSQRLEAYWKNAVKNSRTSKKNKEENDCPDDLKINRVRDFWAKRVADEQAQNQRGH